MNKKLTELQSELEKMGMKKECLDVEGLLRVLAENSLTSMPEGANDLGKWKKVLEMLDSPGGYRVEALHDLADNIIGSVTSRIQTKSNAASPSLEEAPNTSDRQNVINFISSASRNNSSGIEKTASEKIIKNHMNLCNNMFKKEALYLLEKASVSKLSDSEIQILKEAGVISSVGRAFKGLGRGAMRALPVLGLAISLPLAGKNIWEAFQNGKAIVSELPLDKYGITLSAITSGAAGASTIKDQLKNAIDSNKDNPDNVLEIVDILKTIEAFYLDFLFAITNSIMAFIDAATVVNLINPLGGPIWSAILGIGGLILSLGLIGLEWKAEGISEEYWGGIKSDIRLLANYKLNQQSPSAKENVTNFIS